MTSNSAARQATYPRAVEVRRALTSARRCGMEIGAVEVRPDGSIRLTSNAAGASVVKDEFELWDLEGKL